MSISLTLCKNEKVKHHIRMNTHKIIALKFWVENGVNVLCDWTQVSLMLHLYGEPPTSKNTT